MKLATWKKPGTEEIRVYFNGLSCDSKVFAVENEGMYEIRFSRRMYNSQQDLIMDMIDSGLTEMNGGERVIRFDQLLSLAS